MITAVMICTFLAVKNLNEGYTAIKNHDITEDGSYSIVYDDHIYASLGFGIEIDHRESGNAELIEGFLSSCLQKTDKRIVSCFILYTMMIVTVLAYPIYRKYGQSKTKHVISTALSVLLLFALFCIAAATMFSAQRIPIYSPTGHEMTLIISSLLGVIGGSCLLALLLRTAKPKIIISLAAIPAVLALFLFGTTIEARLYCPPTVDSFEYLQKTDAQVFDEDYDGEAYYDEEKNVMVIDGKEHEPKQVDNPEYLQGAASAGAYAYELLDPYLGNSLYLVNEIYAGEGTEIKISTFIMILYAIKASALVVLPLCIKKKQK